MKTPISTIPAFDLSQRITQAMQQAYFRRSRQLPTNIGEMATCLKGDLLKHFPDCPLETVEDAITTSTLYDIDTSLSVAFFFNAVKKAWWQPKSNVHNWQEEPTRPDFEADTCALLDTCAAYLKEAERTADPDKPLSGCVELPAFNPRRSFAYLVMRGQIGETTADHFAADALLKVNTDRMASRHHRLTKDEAKTHPDVLALAKRLAVLDWLKACNTQGRKPSDILTPMANESQYQQIRRNNP